MAEDSKKKSRRQNPIPSPPGRAGRSIQASISWPILEIGTPKMRYPLLILASVLFASTVQAGSLSDCGLGTNDCRVLIGKKLWVVVPKDNPNTVEVSPTQYDYKNTLKMRRGSFLVKDVIPNKTTGYDFVVVLSNGKIGYVWNSSWIFLSETDPVEDARKRAAIEAARRDECAHRGQPKIGMTVDELKASCWGQPRRVIKKTTAQGIQENYIYSPGHVVVFSDGKISEIIESK